MIQRILGCAHASGADCIVTACPMCMANLDMRQAKSAKKWVIHYDMPVYYITELMGVAANLEPKALVYARHFCIQQRPC